MPTFALLHWRRLFPPLFSVEKAWSPPHDALAQRLLPHPGASNEKPIGMLYPLTRLRLH
jgi:hypothetical protein